MPGETGSRPALRTFPENELSSHTQEACSVRRSRRPADRDSLYLLSGLQPIRRLRVTQRLHSGVRNLRRSVLAISIPGAKHVTIPVGSLALALPRYVVMNKMLVLTKGSARASVQSRSISLCSGQPDCRPEKTALKRARMAWRSPTRIRNPHPMPFCPVPHGDQIGFNRLQSIRAPVPANSPIALHWRTTRLALQL
jgi:hypothetical protein